MSSITTWTDRAAADATRLPHADLDWLAQWRDVARERLSTRGWPGSRDEDWRYFDLRALNAWTPEIASAPTDLGASRALVEGLRLPADALRLVFVDGYFQASLSSATDQLQSAGIATMYAALESNPDSVRARLGQLAAFDDHATTAWNAASFTDGLWIDLAPDQTVEALICVVRIQTGTTAHCTSATRNLVHLADGARCAIAEFDIGLGDAETLASAVTEVSVGARARFERLRIQDAPAAAWQLAETRISQGEKSEVAAHVANLGARHARDDIGIRLTGEHARCRFDGLFLLGDDQRADHATIVHHDAPHCISDEAYKGVLRDRSAGAFTGRIVVAEGAQKTDAYQKNRNLLLSDDAQISTRPQLEIYADDVRCSHGATTGQLDETQLFYLMTRGLSLNQARELLTMAFARDLLERVEHPLQRQLMEAALDKHLASDPALESAS